MIEIDRIVATGQKFGPRFWTRVFTEEERKLAEQRNDPHPFYAGRFAAKEAVLKALGTGLRDGRWHDVEIVRGSLGEPLVNVSGKLLEHMQSASIHRILVSISHNRKYAIASALAIRDVDV